MLLHTALDDWGKAAREALARLPPPSCAAREALARLPPPSCAAREALATLPPPSRAAREALATLPPASRAAREALTALVLPAQACGIIIHFCADPAIDGSSVMTMLPPPWLHRPRKGQAMTIRSIQNSESLDS